MLPEPPGGIRPYVGSELRDAVGPNTAVESFYISPIDLEELDLIGACQLEVRAAGYTTKTIDVVVDPIRGQHSRIDRNVGLVRPRDIAGRAFWLDDGPTATPEVNATGVTVRVQGAATTGFDPGTVPFGSAGDDPQPVSEPVAPVVTGADGLLGVLPGVTAGERRRAVPGVRRGRVRLRGAGPVPVPHDPHDRRRERQVGGRRLPRPAAVPARGGADRRPGAARRQRRRHHGAARHPHRQGVAGPAGGQPGRLADRMWAAAHAAEPCDGFSVALSGANARAGTFGGRGPNSTAQRSQSIPVGFGVTPDPGTHQWTVTPSETPADGRPRFKPAAPADGSHLVRRSSRTSPPPCRRPTSRRSSRRSSRWGP